MNALRAFLLVALAMIVSPAEAYIHGSASSSPAFASIPIGGGDVSGISMANDGTMAESVAFPP